MKNFRTRELEMEKKNKKKKKPDVGKNTSGRKFQKYFDFYGKVLE